MFSIDDVHAKYVRPVQEPKKPDDDDDESSGCAGCGYSIVGCFFWPCLFLFCILTGLGLTIHNHYYHLSISLAHGLEIHDDDVGQEVTP